jgi:hypothetical protein
MPANGSHNIYEIHAEGCDEAAALEEVEALAESDAAFVVSEAGV